jgi:thioredoxin reductase (NADPH)
MSITSPHSRTPPYITGRQPLEAQLCAGDEVALVGAGNSAGQAAVYLADRAAKVWMVVRGRSLQAGMSHYLVGRIAPTPQIEVLHDTSVTALDGTAGMLEAIRCRSRRSGEERLCAIRHLFLFIGAEPNTAWLTDSGIALDDKGFVCTGSLETSLPGVFAIIFARRAIRLSRATIRRKAAAGVI